MRMLFYRLSVSLSVILSLSIGTAFLAPRLPWTASSSVPERLVQLSHHGARSLTALGPDIVPPPGAVYTLVVMRHGQSTWNKANRFIGWTDTALTEEGLLEAQIAGKVLRKEGFRFDVCFTSFLKRAIKTAWLVLDELDQHYVYVHNDWRLNERCYGALVSKYKKECVKEYGKDQVKRWRRSYDTPPPPIHESSMFWPGNDPKYNFIPKDDVPRTESLKDTSRRSIACWNEVIVPAIRADKRVLLCGHENNLRSILKHLDNIADDDIMHVELPRAIPLVYFLDQNMRSVPQKESAPYLNGRYLGDPDEVNSIIERDVKQVYDLSVTENLEESGGLRFGDVSLSIRACEELGECDLASYMGLDVRSLQNLRKKLKAATPECRFEEVAATSPRARYPYLAYTNGVKADNWESLNSEDTQPQPDAQDKPDVQVQAGVKPAVETAASSTTTFAGTLQRGPSLGKRGVNMRTHAHPFDASLNTSVVFDDLWDDLFTD